MLFSDIFFLKESTSEQCLQSTINFIFILKFTMFILSKKTIFYKLYSHLVSTNDVHAKFHEVLSMKWIRLLPNNSAMY